MSYKEKIIAAFRNKKYFEAFTGKGNLYSKDPTWGEHDGILVFSYLFDWLRDNETPFIIKEIEEVFVNTFNNYRAISSIDSGLESIHIIRIYCIIANDRSYWPISQDFLIMLFIDNVHKFSPEEIIKFNIERDIEGLREYIPQLPKMDVIIGK